MKEIIEKFALWLLARVAPKDTSIFDSEIKALIVL